MCGRLGVLAKSAKTPEVSSFHTGDPDVIMPFLTCITQSVWLRNPHNLAHQWQTHLSHFPDATANNTSLLNQAHVQYQSGTGEAM
jgi:hypothetical protein